MITLTIKNKSTSQKTLELFNSMDKAKKRGQEVLNAPHLRIDAVSFDDRDEESLCQRLMEDQDAQEGHPRGGK